MPPSRRSWREPPTPDHGIYFVPALVGLGAPYWDAEARGAIFGITRGTTRAEVARAALESVAFQTRDLLEAMRGDWERRRTPARCFASMAAWSPRTGRCSSSPTSSTPRSTGPKVLETTALGAAYLAGLKAGLYPPPAQFAKTWKYERRFKPKMRAAERDALYAGWQARRGAHADPIGARASPNRLQARIH